ncbi:MAG: biotin--[acetyl-CoA-carboxylase] ligase [Cyanobacteriota bacterium]|nr:biotin--[acetyl-CoA-carboxylase] ligase [Cyanobacteriota bacterium]
MWQLRWLPVCGSTETVLDRWLAVPDSPERLAQPRGVLAGRQRFGQGQRGRHWQSPAGGVWLSAALPWPVDATAAAAPGLAAALALAHELRDLGVPVRLKWPNDLVVLDDHDQPHKLAGLLPRLRLRGSRVRWARLGLGLNGCNPVPAGAIALAEPLGPWAARPERLAPLVLRALGTAAALAHQPDAVTRAAEALLWCPPGPVWHQGQAWEPLGLDRGGGLRLGRGDRVMVLERGF